MVLALGLPRSFEHRELILHLTFGVVLISLLLQGLTIKPLLRYLGLAGRVSDRDLYEEKSAALRATQAAIVELDGMYSKKAITSLVYDGVRSGYTQRVQQLEEDIGQIHVEKAELVEGEQLALRRHLLIIEKDSIRHTYHRGLISQHVFQTLEEDLDERSIGLDPEPGAVEPAG